MKRNSEQIRGGCAAWLAKMQFMFLEIYGLTSIKIENWIAKSKT